jgi:hypothetical protein
LSFAVGWPNIQPLVARREAAGKNGRPQKSADFEAKAKNTVDKEKKILHNLASLLLMQRRKTVAKFECLAMCSLKTNSR